MTTALSVLGRVAGRLGVLVAVLALLPYGWGPIYRFPEPVPFSGSQFWNPYANLTGSWQRSNLHAHGRAWGGLTSGEQPDAAVVERYHSLGYPVAGVSDYQYIAAFHGIDTPPLYEHGFNLGKKHQLAIGARRVDWFDFPLWQTLHNQQYVIDRLQRSAALVSLNHPSSRDAYDLTTMRRLTGYNLVEIANGPFTAEDVWDAALSSGHPVWAVANDDIHDLTDARRLAAGWNMIDASTPSTDAIVDALRVGRTYAVLRTGALDGPDATRLSALEVRNGEMSVHLTGAASTVTFIGQNGEVRHTERDVTTASYTLTAADTYVRTVVTSPQSTLFLNPVLRWDGQHLPAPHATVNAAATWTQRIAVLAACALLLTRRWSRRRRLGPNRV